MPKVSAAHLAARREQIIDAAMTRFAENGFQATGMADVIAASGLSAGAVYRYFRSKDELIEAIVDRVLSAAAERLGALLHADSEPDPAAAVRAGVEAMEAVATSGPVDIGRVAVQAWAEGLRSEGVLAIVHGAYSTIHGYYLEVARRAIEAGTLPRAADPEQIASALYSLTAGFVVQRVLIGNVEAQSYASAVRALLDGDVGH